MTKQCNIVYDLLPLYVDQACSEESKELIEEHIKTCSVCKAKYDAMANHIVDNSFQFQTESFSTTLSNKSALLKVLKKIKLRWTIGTLAVLLIVVPILTLTVNQYRDEGISYSNLYDHYKAYRFFHAIKERDYEKAFTFLNMRYYYEEELPRFIAELEGNLTLKDYPLEVEIKGVKFYTNGPTSVTEQYIEDLNEWYSTYKNMTYEQFYETSQIKFIENMREWDKLGHRIEDVSWNFTRLGNISKYEINEISVNLHISNGEFIVKNHELRLYGNNKGQFIFSNISFSKGDEHFERIMRALSIW